MNLLCPSCQSALAVPEQYAGQLMKCPLCSNNFTVPVLAPAAHEPELTFAPDPSAALAPEPDAHDSTPIDLSGHVPPPATPPPPPPEGGHAPYGLTPEPTPPAPPPPTPRPPAPVASTAPAPGTKPAAPPRARPTAPAGYTHSTVLTLHPRGVRAIAPVCLLLVFVLSFFPWVGRYYGGYGVVTQSAWGAAFGGYTVDDVFDVMEGYSKAPEDEKPGPSALTIIFLLVGLIPAVLVGVGAAALPRLRREFRLPPGVTVLEPWRWMIVTGMTLVALLFLLLQLMTNFSIEARAREKVGLQATKEAANSNARAADIKENMELAKMGLRRTVYLRMSFILLVLAGAGGAAAHWLEHRGTDRPLPRFEVDW
jgi:hypothetical protein